MQWQWHHQNQLRECSHCRKSVKASADFCHASTGRKSMRRRRESNWEEDFQDWNQTTQLPKSPRARSRKAKDHDQRAAMGTSARVEKVDHKWMEPKVVKRWNHSANPSTIIQSASWNLWLWHRRNRKRKRWSSSWNHHWNISKAIPRALNSRTKNWKEGKPKKRYNPVSTPSRMPGSIVSQLVSPILPPCDRSCLSYLSLPRLVLRLAWHAVTASPSFLLSPVLLVCHLVSRLVSDAVTVCGLDFLLCALLSPRSHGVSQLGICLRCCLPSGRRDAFVYLSY